MTNNSSPSSYPIDLQAGLFTGVSLNSSQVMSSTSNSTNMVSTNGNLTGNSMTNSLEEQAVLANSVGVNKISESVVNGSCTSCSTSTSTSPQDNSVSRDAAGQVMNQSINGNAVQGNGPAVSSSSQSVLTGASSSSTTGNSANLQPKRLHVSNIPFRFRDPDLRSLFGVSNS